MFVSRAKRRHPVAPAIFLVFALLLSFAPAASVAAQSALDEAYAYLRGIPGLKAQVPNLQVTLETDGDSPASWAAMGEVVLNKRLRNWFKPLVSSPLGWGELPAAGAPVWATFVGLKTKPSLKGPSSIVVHQGFGDGSKVVTHGPEADPFEVDDTLESFGLWWREDVGFYTQAASSSVSASGVNWYDQQFRGAGGISKKMLANVIPIDKGSSGGGNPPPGGGNPPPGGGNPPPGGGNPPPGGGNPPPGGGGVGGDADADADTDAEAVVELGAPFVHLVVEGAKPKKDPTAIKRDHIVWYNGAYRIERDILPGNDVGTCVRTTGTTAANGTILVEVTVQTITPMDPAVLGETVKLQVFDEDGNRLGEFDTDWSSYNPAGPYQGAFVYQGVFSLPASASGAKSVRLSPDTEFVDSAIEAEDVAVADAAIAAGELARAHATNRVAIGGQDGLEPCGKLTSDDLDICSDDIVNALTSVSGGDLAGAGVLASPWAGPNGPHECHVTAGDEFVGAVSSTEEPATEEKLKQVAEIPGCPVKELSWEERRVLMLTCEAVTLFLWLQDMPGGVDIGVDEDDGQIYLSTIFTATVPLLPLPEPEDGEVLDVDGTSEDGTPEDGTPEGGTPIAAVTELLDRVGEAAEQASWRWSVAPGEDA